MTMLYVFAIAIGAAVVWTLACQFVKLEEKNKDINLHVYCTDCIHLHLTQEDVPYCPFEDKCDIEDFEDSKDVVKRPHYWDKRKHGFYGMTKNKEVDGAMPKYDIRLDIWKDKGE